MDATDTVRVKAITMLSGWRAAAGWAAIVTMGVLPFMITIPGWFALAQTGVIALLFMIACILEAGCAEYFNKYNAAKEVNLDRLEEILQKINDDSGAQFDMGGEAANDDDAKEPVAHDGVDINR